MYAKELEDKCKSKVIEQYHFKVTEDLISINAQNKIIGRKPEALMELLENHTVQNLIHEKILTKVELKLDEGEQEIVKYRHVRMKNFVVCLKPDTLEFVQGLTMVENHFKHSDIKKLILEGVFYEVGREVLSQKRKLEFDDENDPDYDPNAEQPMVSRKKLRTSVNEEIVHLYKHLTMKHVGFHYHLKTNELVSFALCSRNFQNVKLRLDFVELRLFYRHSE